MSAIRFLFSFAAGAALSVAALAPLPAQPWRGGPDRGRGGGCTYYSDANYQGMRASLGDGGEIASIGPAWNDRLSSVQCDPGCALETFDHVNFAGARERFRGDVPFVGPGWNDRASALRVQCGRERAHGGCNYYADANYQGMRARLEDGGAIGWVGPAWNDRLSSVRCDPGCALETFEHANFAGASERFRGDVAFVGPAWNDRASALRVQCGGGRDGGRKD